MQQETNHTELKKPTPKTPLVLELEARLSGGKTHQIIRTYEGLQSTTNRKTMERERECDGKTGKETHGCPGRSKVAQEIMQKPLAFYHALSDKVSDKEVLRTASGGLALQGIYYTGHLVDMLESREQLIEVPESFSLGDPEQNSTFRQKEFLSCSSQTAFQALVEKVGFSLSCPSDGGAEAGEQVDTTEDHSSSELREMLKSVSAQTSVWVTKYHYVPQATSSIEKLQLRLSHSALQELQVTESLLSNRRDTPAILTNRVKVFFERFGSHVNQGPLHFGGVFWWKASAEGFQSTKLTEMRSLITEALDTYIGADIEKALMQLNRQLTKIDNNSLIKVKISASHTGGPANMESHLHWKSLLVSSRRTWSLTDRGSSLIPVWDIVLSNHRRDFKDAVKLKSTLKHTYEILTEQCTEEKRQKCESLKEPPEQSLSPNVQVDQPKYQSMSVTEPEPPAKGKRPSQSKNTGKGIGNEWIRIRDKTAGATQHMRTEEKRQEETAGELRERILVATFCERDQSSCVAHLTSLLDIKRRLYRDTGNHHIWFNTYFLDCSLQSCLVKTMEECMYCSEEESNEIKKLIRKLLEPDPFAAVDFPKMLCVIRWAYASERNMRGNVFAQDVPELITILRKEKERIKSSASETEQETQIEATALITLSINHLRQMLRMKQQYEAEILMLSVVSATGYRIKGNMFSHLLSWKDIDFMEKQMLQSYERYCNLNQQSVSKAQAYTLVQTLTTAKDSGPVSSEDKQKRLDLFKMCTGDSISSEISAILGCCQKISIDWETAEKELKSVYEKCEPVKEHFEKSVSHINLENVQEHQFASVPDTNSMVEVENNISSEITAILESCKKSSTDWGTVEEELKSVYQKCEPVKECLESSLSHNNLENEQKHQFVPVPATDSLGEGEKLTKPIKTGEGTGTKVRKTVERKINRTHSAFKNLLVRLGLLKYYPQKLRKTDILVIDKLSLQMNHPITEEELPFHYLYKLMMLDYRARTVVWKEDRKTTHVEEQGPSAGAGDVDSEDEDFFSNETRQTCEETEDQLTHIHPMDIHMAVFHCADDFLRQYLLLKYTTCQYALPLLIPQPCSDTIEFPLWALRQVKKTWGCKDLSEKDGFIKCKNSHVFNTSVPTVSFLRLGNCSASKSQILNSVISKQKHNIFFHRHCRGSTAHCLLMDGVVEIAWYCPGGKEDDIFDNCLSFTNLHGDASQLPAQVEFLQEVSAVSVVLISGSLNEAARKTSEALLKSPAPVIFLFDDNSIVSRGKNPNKVKLAVRNKNEAELVDRIISNIKCFVTEQSNTSSLSEFLSTARRLRFDIDENNEKCMEGNAIASAVLRWIKEENLTAVKERLLPLQGKLWYDWCTKNKEQYRLKGNASKSIEQQLCEIKKEKKVIRSEQLKKAFPLNGLMRSFLECLGSSSLSRDTKMFMLQWLRTYLDDLTTETLLKLEEKYHTQWTGMRKNKNTIKRGVEFRLQKELDLISEELNAATLGIQHFFREMGQIYEAQLDNRERIPKTQDYVHCLPDIGAEMLISGYPLELMDGDAAHVPLEWIGAVLDKLIEKNGNKRVFVLSVLGIQSSGKSTLLNTMFGLQFTVSAGRCTRGAFMQLVRVDEEVREQLQYDYVLIVDTEGLRSPELSNKSLLSHDNELATFIIGIGDMTLINIMGENPSEMQDILQICVQAFMRMKRVKLNPSCIFVHQNVAETSAGEKNMEGRRRLQERLDEMTQIAAKEEHCDVAAFSDIIHFDVESQVFYFKNLLEGDPPMAPPNPSYSQNVQELKTKMLSIAKWRPNCRFSTLTEFKSRTEDLWNSLLGENFVFSFKNTLEMVVYSNLEKAYGTWTWQLRKCAIEVQNRLRNQIMNNIIQDIRALNHMQAFDETYRKITTEIEKYFSEEKHSGLLIQWRANTEKRLEMVKHDLTMETHDMCVELIRFKKSQFELDQKKSKYEAQLLTRSKALATELKGKASNKMDIKKAFQKLWVEWSDEISALHVPKNEEDIEAVVDTILLDCFKKHVDLIAKVMKKSERFLFNEKTHISKQSKMVLLTQRFTYKDRVSVDELTEDITQTVNTYIERKKEEKLDFSQSYIYGMLDEIKEHIDEFGQSVKHFRITDDYRVELSIYLCRSSMEKFKDMRKAFRKANDPLAYLFSKRSEYVKMFESFCQGITSTTFFADFLCTKLKPAIQQAVYDKASIRITEEMRSNYPAFSGNRSNLENHILRHLAEVGNFNSYMEYINHPKRYFVRFIRQHVAKYCKCGDSLVRLLKESLESLIKTVCSTSNEVTAVVQVNQGNASMWLNKFCADIGGHIVLSRDDLRSIEAEDISDLHFFKNTMQENLAVMAHELKEGFKDKTTDRSQFRKKPDDILTQQLSGCWEQCPFCKAICTNTIPGHDTDHSIQFHRPMALARWYYHNTEHICIEFCTTSVSSDRSFYPHHGDVRTVPWKKYKEAGPPYSTWSITPDHSEKLYWKWIICTWQEEMEKKTGKKFTGPGEIPESWKTITKQAVLQELQ